MPIYLVSYLDRKEITEEEVVLWILCPEEDTRIEYVNLKMQLHREDGPAVIHSDGTQSWYKEGKRVK